MERTKEELEQLRRDVIALNTPDEPWPNSRCSASAGSIHLGQSVIRIKGHGERIANAYVDGYYFLETDTEGPLIDAVHESFVESNTKRSDTK